MRLDRPFLKLPIRFSAEALEAEVRALPPTSWVPHATGFPGNEAVRLVTPGGAATDEFDGPMRPTQDLARCAYIQQVMAELGGVWGRSRLMGLGVGAEVPEHVDCHYHWRTHLRIHVPVITNPGVAFTCDGETVHMAAGECWVFDSFRWHEVHNRGTERRVHLVLDTVVSPTLWDLIDAARSTPDAAARELRPGERAPEPLLFERLNAPRVMSPWEMRCHIAFILGDAVPHPALENVSRRLDRLADSWAALWAQYGAADSAVPAYRRMINDAHGDLDRAGAGVVELHNELKILFVVEQLIFIPAIGTSLVAAAEGQRLAS